MDCSLIGSQVLGPGSSEGEVLGSERHAVWPAASSRSAGHRPLTDASLCTPLHLTSLPPPLVQVLTHMHYAWDTLRLYTNMMNNSSRTRIILSSGAWGQRAARPRQTFFTHTTYATARYTSLHLCNWHKNFCHKQGKLFRTERIPYRPLRNKRQTTKLHQQHPYEMAILC